MFENDTITGFGTQLPYEVEDLAKALSFTSQDYSTTLPSAFTGAPALQVESLDKTLRLVTFQEQDLHIWKDIPKTPAFNTVEEFNTQNSYGADIPAFFSMGTAPNVADSGYNRDLKKIKYLGTQKQINHDVMLVRQAHGPIVQREIKNGALWILGQMERALQNAAEGLNTYEFDGISQQVDDGDSKAEFQADNFVGYEGYGGSGSSFLDTREGSPTNSPGVPDEELLEEAALRQSNNFGTPTDLYWDTKAHSDFSRAFYGKERINTLGIEGKAGYVVKQFVSGSGTFNLKSGKFQRPRRRTLTSTVSAFGAPTLANATAGDNSPVSGSSQFETDDAGTYYYKVSAVYVDGETLASTAKSVTVAAGDKVVLDITPASGTPLYYNVFRSALGAANGNFVEYIGRVALIGSGQNYDLDFNAQLPGLSTGYLLQMNEDNITFRQLMTMMKVDLALTGTQWKWMQLLYGTPIMFSPRKNEVITNIARN